MLRNRNGSCSSPSQMAQEAASSPPADSDHTTTLSCSHRPPDLDLDVVGTCVVIDPVEECIEAQLLRDADPGLRRRYTMQASEIRARQEAARRAAWRSRAQRRMIGQYTDLLLRVDVSGFTELHREEYERELKRLGQELFGPDG